jgi:NitT/TauT family transport system ATP-binding protein
VLTLRDVRVAYGGDPVLDRVDLRVERGAVHAAVGPTGCGKTTLLHLLAGLRRPTRGELLFDRAEDQGSVAYIPQDYGLFPWKTVAQNARMGLEIQARKNRKRSAGARPSPSGADAQRVERLLAELRIASLGDRWPATLSGGQRQRVAIARALAVEPRLLLMDEPFSALDADIREDLQDLVRGLPARFGTTPVLVTHDIREAVRVADRIILFAPLPDAEPFECFTVELVEGCASANAGDHRACVELEARIRDRLRDARRTVPGTVNDA